jgi:hypothetical protein
MFVNYDVKLRYRGWVNLYQITVLNNSGGHKFSYERVYPAYYSMKCNCLKIKMPQIGLVVFSSAQWQLYQCNRLFQRIHRHPYFDQMGTLY